MNKANYMPLHLLRILSGTNAGARTILKTGNYTVGSSPNSDIILHDDHIASQHIKITVSDRGILLYPLASPVYVDGKDIGQSEYKLNYYQVITVGNIHFAIGSVKKSWPTIKRPVIEKKKQSVPLKASPVTNKKTTDSNNSPWFKALLVGLGVLLIANLLYFKPDITGLLTNLGLKKNLELSFTETINEMKLPGVQIETLNNGKTRVNGYVKNAREKRELLSRISDLDKSVSHRIWVDTELVEHANYIANTFDETDIGFTMPEHGILKASGFVRNAANWSKVRQNILSDVDGIASIDDENVDSLKQQLEKFKTFISSEHFFERLELFIQEGEIIVTGELTNDELLRWDTVKQNFVNAYGNLPALTENLQSPRSRFKLAIRSVSVGKVPFITSKDEKKYMIGSHLGEGYYVKSITAEKIVLRHNDLEIPVYFGENAK
jgi:type III secretion system YscD/HrpQ family protein